MATMMVLGGHDEGSPFGAEGDAHWLKCPGSDGRGNGYIFARPDDDAHPGVIFPGDA